MYSLAIYLYMFCVNVAALFNKKARLMMRGHRQTYRILREQIHHDEKYIWFHAASLGEFEQGRTLIEKIRAAYPQYRILLSFFSPSGYEVRKDYKGADVVCYLPFDTALNARKFIRLARPCMAFFIKYEFWQNYLT
ncbi:MAG: glycosyltransferase N-terminal domain-containing protein, partial [Bacteroidaceae bacterium]